MASSNEGAPCERVTNRAGPMGDDENAIVHTRLLVEGWALVSLGRRSSERGCDLVPAPTVASFYRAKSIASGGGLTTPG